jgi:hypothetical protein
MEFAIRQRDNAYAPEPGESPLSALGRLSRPDGHGELAESMSLDPLIFSSLPL